MACANIALAVLAAGAASRFGGRKLEALLGEEVIGALTAKRLVSIDFIYKLAICNMVDRRLIQNLTALKFSIITNLNPADGMSASISLAAQAAKALPVEGLLIILADMPSVTVEHIEAMISAFKPPMQTIASHHNGVAMPPALFPRAQFDALSKLSGPKGAQALLKNSLLIAANADDLIDIDTRDDFQVLLSNKMKRKTI